MKKVYLDVNIVFDYLLERKPFNVEAIQIFELARLGKIEAITDTQTITFVFFYMVKTDTDRRRVKNKLIGLLEFLSLTNLSATALMKALAMDDPVDLEDAAQLQVAIEVEADVFITRDLDDYKNADFPIQSPPQFLRGYSEEKR